MKSRTKSEIIHAAILGGAFFVYQVAHGLWKVGLGRLELQELVTASKFVEFTTASAILFAVALAALLLGGRVRGNDIILGPLFAWLVAGGVAAFLIFGVLSASLRWATFLVGGLLGVGTWAGIMVVVQVIRTARRPNKAL